MKKALIPLILMAGVLPIVGLNFPSFAFVFWIASIMLIICALVIALKFRQN